MLLDYNDRRKDCFGTKHGLPQTALCNELMYSNIRYSKACVFTFIIAYQPLRNKRPQVTGLTSGFNNNMIRDVRSVHKNELPVVPFSLDHLKLIELNLK